MQNIKTAEKFLDVQNHELRNQYVNRTEVLEKVKGLAMLPDDVHVTVEMAAGYYEVDLNTVRQTVKRHFNELYSDGTKVLTGENLKAFKATMVHDVLASKYQRINSLTLLPRRAVLRIGMLLRDSEVARTVRDYLLNVEKIARQKDSSINHEAMIELLQENNRTLKLLWGELQEVKTENRILTPKAERFDRFLDAKNNIRIGDMAKSFHIKGMGQKKMFDYLRTKGLVYMDRGTKWNLPYQVYVNTGIFTVKWREFTVYNNVIGDYVTKEIPTTYVTPKGVDYIYGLLKDDGIIKEECSVC